MRLGVALGATASVVAISLGIISVGRHLAGDDAPPVAIEPGMAEPPDPGPETTERVREPGSEPPDSPFVSGRRLPKDDAGFQRVEPRAPLSKLGQAQPPLRKMSNDWEGTNLYRPVVNAAGVFEAMGYTVTVAGTDIVGAGEMCVFRGKSWPCGALARTAFRSFLRGRAVTCALPSDSEMLTASSGENVRRSKNPAQVNDFEASASCAGGGQESRRALPYRQAERRRMAGVERLGACGRERPLWRRRKKGAVRGERNIWPASTKPSVSIGFPSPTRRGEG